MTDEERWEKTWSGLGLRPPAKAWPDLLERMQERHRAYHTLQHLRECFGWLDECRSLVERPAEVEACIWYHDAVYAPRGGDNEERSARLAREVLHAAGAADTVLARIETLILATKHHRAGTPGDVAWMIDIDLAILAAEPARFAEYEVQVRREYRWVPGFLFRRKRRAFLQSMLERPAIFQTPFFRERLEARARGNLQGT